MISDVPGDDPAVIASGPTVPDNTTALDALRIVRKYDLGLPEAALAHLKHEADRTHGHTPDVAEGNSVTMIATPFLALQAAAERARQAGVTPLVLGDALEGKAVRPVWGWLALRAPSKCMVCLWRLPLFC